MYGTVPKPSHAPNTVTLGPEEVHRAVLHTKCVSKMIYIYKYKILVLVLILYL